MTESVTTEVESAKGPTELAPRRRQPRTSPMNSLRSPCGKPSCMLNVTSRTLMLGTHSRTHQLGAHVSSERGGGCRRTSQAKLTSAFPLLKAPRVLPRSELAARARDSSSKLACSETTASRAGETRARSQAPWPCCRST